MMCNIYYGLCVCCCGWAEGGERGWGWGRLGDILVVTSASRRVCNETRESRQRCDVMAIYVAPPATRRPPPPTRRPPPQPLLYRTRHKSNALRR